MALESRYDSWRRRRRKAGPQSATAMCTPKMRRPPIQQHCDTEKPMAEIRMSNSKSILLLCCCVLLISGPCSAFQYQLPRINPESMLKKGGLHHPSSSATIKVSEKWNILVERRLGCVTNCLYLFSWRVSFSERLLGFSSGAHDKGVQ